MSIRVLLLASGDHWEAGVLAAADAAGIVVIKRCVDLTDLLATASLGQAHVAVVSADLPHLDAEAVQHLRRWDVALVAVGRAADEDRVHRLGASRLVEGGGVEIAAGVVACVAEAQELRVPVAASVPDVDAVPQGRVTAIWGPAGAPGRTSIAAGLAAEVAAAGRRAVLVDADPYGGAVAARLGILDEASGLLSVARSANAGTLDRHGLASSCRRVAANLDVLTGLPRADRRIELRPGVTSTVLEVAAGIGDVFVDTGFCVEDGDRDRMTLEALGTADDVIVVGLADPIGLTRLARGIVDLRDHLADRDTPIRIVLNRYRPGLRWCEQEVEAMVGGYVVPRSFHVVPDDVSAMDQALVTGRTLVELGLSPVRSALVRVAEACFPEAFGEARPRRRRAAPTGRFRR